MNYFFFSNKFISVVIYENDKNILSSVTISGVQCKCTILYARTSLISWVETNKPPIRLNKTIKIYMVKW